MPKWNLSLFPYRFCSCRLSKKKFAYHRLEYLCHLEEACCWGYIYLSEVLSLPLIHKFVVTMLTFTIWHDLLEVMMEFHCFKMLVLWYILSKNVIVLLEGKMESSVLEFADQWQRYWPVHRHRSYLATVCDMEYLPVLSMPLQAEASLMSTTVLCKFDVT